MAASFSGCLFCGLDEPAVTVYRDATAQAFISLAPVNRYHVIVAPRAHFEHLAELPAITLSAAPYCWRSAWARRLPPSPDQTRSRYSQMTTSRGRASIRSHTGSCT